MSASSNKEHYIHLLMKLLLLKLTEAVMEQPPAMYSPYVGMLNALRAEIYSNAGQFSSVSQLAAKMNLSPSYFQQIYKKYFGISCYEDLLSAKMKIAQYYLSSTMLSISEIAALCGYENDVCFMRRFKSRTGLTPTEYRNWLKGADNRVLP